MKERASVRLHQQDHMWPQVAAVVSQNVLLASTPRQSGDLQYHHAWIVLWEGTARSWEQLIARIVREEHTQKQWVPSSVLLVLQAGPLSTKMVKAKGIARSVNPVNTRLLALPIAF